MSGWTKIEEGTITLIHHSAASVIQIIYSDEEHRTQELWLDYYEIVELKKAIEKIEIAV